MGRHRRSAPTVEEVTTDQLPEGVEVVDKEDVNTQFMREVEQLIAKREYKNNQPDIDLSKVR